MKYKYQIEKGDRFMCIQDYIMDDTEEIAYTKGLVYESEKDECITDNEGDKQHHMDGQEDFFEHFTLLKQFRASLETA